MNKTILGIIIAVVIVGGGFILFRQKSSAPTIPETQDNSSAAQESTEAVSDSRDDGRRSADGSAEGDSTAAPAEGLDSQQKTAEETLDQPLKETPKIVTVKFNGAGYFSKAVSIKKGEVVTWVNESSVKTWPASAMHPTHTVYPGSDIQKCFSGKANEVFDACRGLNQGETYSFIFNEVGTWYYHDHLSPGMTGSVTVQE